MTMTRLVALSSRNVNCTRIVLPIDLSRTIESNTTNGWICSDAIGTVGFKTRMTVKDFGRADYDYHY